VTYVTDTHPLVWHLAGDQRLSVPARLALTDTTAKIVVPIMVLVEICFLYARGRVSVDLPAAKAYIAGLPNCQTQPVDEQILDRVPTGLDIHDAIIVATALYYRDVLGERVALITRDVQTTQSGPVDTLW
jgi:PIN domain nuclease of toxin-antitoxin system